MRYREVEQIGGQIQNIGGRGGGERREVGM